MGIREIFTIFRSKRIKNKISFERYKDEWASGVDPVSSTLSTQMKLSAVYRCVEILSNSVGKLPFTVIDTKTHKSTEDRPSVQLKYLLNNEPNSNMNSFIFHKLMETSRLLTGNAYAVIKTNLTGYIESLTPVDSSLVTVQQLDNGKIVYDIIDKKKNTKRYISEEILHLKGISTDGFVGQSVLSYARGVTDNASLQEDYTNNFYSRKGRPSAIVAIDAQVARAVKTDPNGKTPKEIVREEWEKFNAGSNSGRVAIMQQGETYTPIPQISQKDMAFIEAKEMSVADIARFFGVPLYKLFAGKESYQSNEQNGIAYVTDTLVPIVTQYEQEYTNKALSDRQKYNGVSVKANLNNEMRGDLNTRQKWYQTQAWLGVLSINDIRALEDMPSVEGGDIRLVSKNYASLEYFTKLEKAGLNNATQ